MSFAYGDMTIGYVTYAYRPYLDCVGSMRLIWTYLRPLWSYPMLWSTYAWTMDYWA